MFAAPITDRPYVLPKKDKQIGVRITLELEARLKVMAEKERRTLADFIRIKLEELVEKADEKSKS